MTKKITLSLKKYKKSTIKLAEKYFDPNLKGEWIGLTDKTNLFVSTYIQEKFKNDIHFIPYADFLIIYDEKLEKTFLRFVDYKVMKMFFVDEDSLENYFEKIRNTDKRFTFFPITEAQLNYEKDGLEYHSISALYDKKTNKVEIFDSIGRDFTYYKEISVKKLFTEIYSEKVKIV
jgi:hypothetical protein